MLQMIWNVDCEIVIEWCIFFLFLEQYVTNLGLDLYYYCYFLIYNSHGWRFPCCLRVGLMHVFVCWTSQRALNEMENLYFDFSLRCFVSFIQVSLNGNMWGWFHGYRLWMIAWWNYTLSLQEADHRLSCFVSFVAVSHMLKTIMKQACQWECLF